MLIISIPGYKDLNLKYLVTDLNGTLANNGLIKKTTAFLLNKISQNLKVYIITADTFGIAGEVCSSLQAELTVLKGGGERDEKAAFIKGLGSEETVTLGNGANDELMLEQSVLGIVVIGEEGCCTKSLLKSDIVVKDVDDALRMLLNPDILKAALRS
ncbi:HAD family hydrolase [Candidatus Contubernalis alkaliaceticus]|uniref:HAD family hydrolase n=1 Tax=Candidatus Contubernalis alkaliaceticus TaxID=338645 RepID=UPI001F4C1371|nr:ATPase P [Candidatus Contubernalis alkalaceticus]UNC92997.1 ATPase P [Candidatus Contubernalis alkalaceticus]